MIDIITTELKRSNDKTNSFLFLLNFFILPIRAGLFGFIVFFLFLLITKLLGYLLGNVHQFSLNFSDLILPILGFLLISTIKFLENFKSEPSKLNYRLSKRKSALSRFFNYPH